MGTARSPSIMSICRDLRRGQTRASKPESLSKYTPRGTKIGEARVTSISREIFRNDNEPSWAHAARCEVSIISINPQSFLRIGRASPERVSGSEKSRGFINPKA